jgi:hypothetical protein
MDKVFCKDCKHRNDDSYQAVAYGVGAICRKRSKDLPQLSPVHGEYQIMVAADCYIENKNYDCSDFELPSVPAPTLWQKLKAFVLHCNRNPIQIP